MDPLTVVTTPLLPELVHTNQVQNVSLALNMLAPLGLLPADDPHPVNADDPHPVNADDPHPMDADGPRQTGTVPRTSSRLKKPNPKYLGEPWN